MLYNPMTHGAHASLYNPMTHGDLYPLYNVVRPHDPWGFVTIAAPMTHGEKVAEGARKAEECTYSVQLSVPSQLGVVWGEVPQGIAQILPRGGALSDLGITIALFMILAE